jgi:hypothetical protein
MNKHLKHELITWGIFFSIVVIVVYPTAKLVMYLKLSLDIIALLSMSIGMLIMLVVEWFVKNKLKL